MEAGALVVEGFDAGEEPGVEENGVLMGGEFGGFDLLDFFEGGIGVGAGDGVEGGHDAVEEASSFLHGDEGVREGGWCGVVGDGGDFPFLLSHAGLDGGLVVGVVNTVEGRSVEREGAGRVEGVRRAEGGGLGDGGWMGHEDGGGGEEGSGGKGRRPVH